MQKMRQEYRQKSAKMGTLPIIEVNLVNAVLFAKYGTYTQLAEGKCDLGRTFALTKYFLAYIGFFYTLYSVTLQIGSGILGGFDSSLNRS